MMKLNKVLIKLKLLPMPVQLGHTEILDAWGKIESVLSTSFTVKHVEVAQNMFDLMLHRFNIKTKEQLESPAISAMQFRIDQTLERVITNTIH